eukprot:TRINITY_DN24697_c0_g1_i1.p1 TRINITY_DN24697_c0_g1~~TRINITY_DN24697_c0_g1_i1.p1  ORF type:complete len:273 (-),score=59.24 TRINITY_DN24697_c0_g1_i1:93-911(-)
MSIALGALKNFVAEPTGQKQGDDTVVLHVTHSNLSHHFNELRFDLHTTVESIKEKLRNHTGTPVDAQKLELYDSGDKKVCDLSDNHKSLGFYSPLDGYRIHVVDLDPSSISSQGWLEDISLVEKYSISEEDYDKREDSFRKFKAKKLAADPSWTLEKEMAMRRGEKLPEVQIVTEDHMADQAACIHVGDRCEVDPGAKRGLVLFVGKAEALAPGFWVGVQYDEPVGKHDGLVRGHRYFSCPQGFGAMLRPDKVKVGDFPERDPFEEEEPDEI